MRTPAILRMLGVVLSCVVAATFASGLPSSAVAEAQCVVVKAKETQGELKVLHFRNACKFSVWAIIQNKDTGQYSIHKVEPGKEHEDVGIKVFPEIAGWCRTGDNDCLREWGLK